ncbi:TIGR01777 family oxidoreductase [Pseudodesulfovibrio sp. S3]|uniref:TIGR01777 family oxidoreductase n=1 Tax=unclassified Pseudodesulfovibrio TaxID=2661612 RepID=UPI000FEBE713|nr:TIGR01777 family oxidoreductase [Pseudodesulfovibrio sp. S3]MCJ2165625.1 TIGR01777 family oxidoreductase [Pseudodesulfovibrio sp. S3-i]RWU03032.1 TIGR01777 family protein [Pseudodesulfovibrio sp. S3]
MRAIIAGGTGFIGRALVRELKEHGWEIVVLSRNPGKVAAVFDTGVIGMPWDNGDWPDMIEPDTAVVNLAGEDIAGGRWTGARKRRILDSRVRAGERIVQAVKKAGVAPGVLIQASAVGYYGPCGNTPVNEYAESGKGFLAEVTRRWESSTSGLEELGSRRCIVRTGVVLGQGGALKRMLPPFRYFLGGPPGSGFQGVSWIHLHDEVRAIRFLMENPEASGPYNLTSPNPVNFRKFAHALGTVLNRPYKTPVPPFALRLLFGEMADEVLLSGQLALPERLMKAGFTFGFPDLRDALRDILR